MEGRNCGAWGTKAGPMVTFSVKDTGRSEYSEPGRRPGNPSEPGVQTMMLRRPRCIPVWPHLAKLEISGGRS